MQTCENILRPLKGHEGHVYAVAISPDGRYIVSGSSDGTARIWDAQTGAELLKFTEHKNFVCAVVFWPDSSRVISNDCYRIFIWDVSSGDIIRSFAEPDHYVDHLDCSADGRFILGAYRGDVSIWNVVSGELVPQSSEELTDFVSMWSGSGRWYTYSDGRVRAWRVDSDNSGLGYTPLFCPSISQDREYMALPHYHVCCATIYSRRPHRNERPSL